MPRQFRPYVCYTRALCQNGNNFRPICGFISETVIDKGIVTMEDEHKVVCALLNTAAFDDLE